MSIIRNRRKGSRNPFPTIKEVLESFIQDQPKRGRRLASLVVEKHKLLLYDDNLIAKKKGENLIVFPCPPDLFEQPKGPYIWTDIINELYKMAGIDRNVHFSAEKKRFAYFVDGEQVSEEQFFEEILP